MANLNLSEFTEKLFVADADHTFIWDTAASISKRVSRNSWLSGTTADFHLGLADAASPVAQTISVQSVVAGTTNTAGANFSINGSQGTGTGAGGSLLLRTSPAGSSGTAQNALVTAVAITSAGNVGIGTTSPTSKLHVVGTIAAWKNATDYSAHVPAGEIFGYLNATGITTRLKFDDGSGNGTGAGLYLPNNGIVGWQSLARTDAGTLDTILLRDGEQDHLAMRRGALGQKFSVYGTYPGAAWERFTITAPTSGNVLLGTYIGTGGVPRGMEFQTNGVTRITIGATGTTTLEGNNNSISGFRFFGLGSSALLIDSGAGGFNRLCLGGTTASFPALKRVGAEFQIVKADTTAASNVAADDADLTFIEDRYRRKGAGSPEGVVTAPTGAVYHNTSGGSTTTFYVKESSPTPNTGWVGK